jgi:hypothetical protein
MNAWSSILWCLLVIFCLSVRVMSMWMFWVLLCMHLLGAAECVVFSCVFVTIYIQLACTSTLHELCFTPSGQEDVNAGGCVMHLAGP